MSGKVIALRPAENAPGEAPGGAGEPSKNKGGRPRGEPTATISARLSLPVLAELDAMLERRRQADPSATRQTLLAEALQKLLATERRAAKKAALGPSHPIP